MMTQRRARTSVGSLFREAVLGGVILAAVGMSSGALADSIVLSDGRVLTGLIKHEGKTLVVTADDGSGEPVRVNARDVVAINLTTPESPENAAHAEWTRTAVLIRRSNDLAEIVHLHQAFLDKFPNDGMAAQVRLSLGEYQKLKDQNGVKFLGRWMPAAQVGITVHQWQADAKEAEDLYRGGRITQALDAAQRALKNDDENPYALVLAGLSTFRLNRYQSSREFFLNLATVDPSSVIAENNLGVISTLINLPSESLSHYARALQIAPQNRLLLDNITEALYVYPKDRSNGVVQNLMRPYGDAEGRMETTLAAKGLFRVGATWATQQQRDRLNTNRQVIEGALVKLQANYNSAVQAHATVDQQLITLGQSRYATASDLDYLNWIVLTYGATPDIQLQRNALQAQLDRMDAQRMALQNQRDSMPDVDARFGAESQRFQQSLAQINAAGFSGAQRIMDLGEDVAPPAPALLQIPALPPPSPVLAEAPVVPGQPGESLLAAGYQQWATPIGIPLIPISWGGGHHDHGGHGDDGDHHHHPHPGDDDGTPNTPPSKPTVPTSGGSVSTVHFPPIRIGLGGDGGFHPIRGGGWGTPVTPSVPVVVPTPVSVPVPTPIIASQGPRTFAPGRAPGIGGTGGNAGGRGGISP